jgi:hypothetical protein
MIDLKLFIDGRRQGATSAKIDDSVDPESAARTTWQRSTMIRS